MVKGIDHRGHQLVFSHRSPNRRLYRVRRHVWNEPLGRKLRQRRLPIAARQHRDMVPAGVLHHRLPSRRRFPRRKLMCRMFFPQPNQFVFCYADANVNMVTRVNHQLLLTRRRYRVRRNRHVSKHSDYCVVRFQLLPVQLRLPPALRRRPPQRRVHSRSP